MLHSSTTPIDYPFKSMTDLEEKVVARAMAALGEYESKPYINVYVPPAEQKVSMNMPPYSWTKNSSNTGPTFKTPAPKVLPWKDRKLDRCKGKDGWGKNGLKPFHLRAWLSVAAVSHAFNLTCSRVLFCDRTVCRIQERSCREHVASKEEYPC
jgi:hypothetical protein